ncbi:MAG: type II secretion system protein [Microgenomates group bacterium]|jgi:type II secretory pathway pseudopilin PulG
MLPRFKFKFSDFGFTLVELLIVTGVLTFLLAMVLIAINPGAQLAAARNTQRHSDVNVILNAVGQYLVKYGSLPAGITTSAQIVRSSGGLDICSLLVTEFVAALPADPSSGSYTDCTNYNTGYTIAKSATNNRVTVSAPSAESATVTVSR